MRSEDGSTSERSDNRNILDAEGLAGRIEQAVYDYVYETFGRAEAEDPSWYTPDLARYVARVLADTGYEAKHRIKYDNN